MSTQNNAVRELDALKDLIVSSIEAVKDNVIESNDPPLTLKTLEEHPIYRRNDPAVNRALKTTASAAEMLKALCDPNTFINDITYGYHDETALLVACQANIPGLLGDKERHVDELAGETGLHPDRLARFLRNLCNSLIFQEVAPNRFANNALSARFISESKRAIVGHCADECRVSSCKTWEALTWPEFKDATAANKAPFNIAYDTDQDYFTFVGSVRPDIGNRCKKAMQGKGLNLGQYLNLYPWGAEKGAHIIDVGGGIGAATLPILRAFPELRLTVQDLPDSGPEFQKNINGNFADIDRGRLQYADLDFFQSAPQAGGDIYFLRHVIHDWPEAEAVRILQGCASVMKKENKLLICEHVVCPTFRSDNGQDQDEPFVAPEPLLANWGDAPTSRLDLQVYTCLNAKQRTKQEYEDLVSKAGFELVRVRRNMGDETILECRLR